MSVDMSYPVRDPNKCDNCGRCEAQCPYGAWQSSPRGMILEQGKCRRCGVCQGGCPVQAISLAGCDTRHFLEVLETLDTKITAPGEPVALAFLCANSGDAVDREARRNLCDYPANIIPMTVPCVGAVHPSWVADAFTGGVDGILIAGCKRCVFGQGYSLARDRMDTVRDSLSRMFLDPQRVCLAAVTKEDYTGFVRQVCDFVQQLKN